MGNCGDGEKKIVKDPVAQDIPEFKIILIGDSFVGKTAIIHSYIYGTFGKTKPTAGVSNQEKFVDIPTNISPRFPKRIK